MNYSRVFLGMVLAAAILFLTDLSIYHYLLPVPVSRSMSYRVMVVTSLLLESLITGFALAWLYAFARSHYGPGPRTAFRMATLVWSLTWFASVLRVVHMPSAMFFGIWAITFVSMQVAAYIAGWQYIADAPR